VSTKELNMLGDGTAAATELKHNLVKPICVENSHVEEGVFAEAGRMVQLDFKAQFSQRCRDEMGPSPFLK